MGLVRVRWYMTQGKQINISTLKISICFQPVLGCMISVSDTICSYCYFFHKLGFLSQYLILLYKIW